MRLVSSPSDNATAVLYDLEEDKSWTLYSVFRLCDKIGVAQPYYSIVQHDVPHNFDAADQNSALHPTCIINNAYAYADTDVWCTSCGNTVHNGIDN